jgi:hypothetical protein
LNYDEASVRGLMTRIAGRCEPVESGREFRAISALDSIFDIADRRHGHGFNHFSDGSSRAAERHGGQEVQHALGLLDDEAALGDALESKQAHRAQPRVDIGQDVDGGGHLGERVAARVEGIDHAWKGSLNAEVPRQRFAEARERLG